jgi:hypothetical protein
VGAWDYDASGPEYTFNPGSYAALVTFPGSGAVNYWASAPTTGDNTYIWGSVVDAPSQSTDPFDVAFNLMGISGQDCNGNGIPDDCDVAPLCQAGVDCYPDVCSEDCNEDAVPDECQLEGNDCNENMIPDDCDIASGFSQDCNDTGVPDECELEGNDCNENDIPDECDIASGYSQDCNDNDVPDECDVASGASCDCQDDGVPDECQLWTEKGTVVVIDESFEDEFPPVGWTVEQLGADPWIQTDNLDFAHTGLYGVYHAWGAAGPTEDSWLITPELTLTTAS